MTLYDCTELLVLRMTRWRGLHFPMAVYFSVPNSYGGLAFQLQTVDDRPSSAWRPRRWWGRYTTPTGAAFALQCYRRLFVALAKLLSGPTGDLREDDDHKCDEPADASASKRLKVFEPERFIGLVGERQYQKDNH